MRREGFPVMSFYPEFKNNGRKLKKKFKNFRKRVRKL
jgi:hypothetical protein